MRRRMLKLFENTERQGVIGIVTVVRGLEGHGLLCTNTGIATHADSLGLHDGATGLIYPHIIRVAHILPSPHRKGRLWNTFGSPGFATQGYYRFRFGRHISM